MNRFFFQDFKTDTKFVQTDNLISKLYNNKLIFLENAFSLKENDSIVWAYGFYPSVLRINMNKRI